MSFSGGIDCQVCGDDQVAKLANKYNAMVHFRSAHGEDGAFCASCCLVTSESLFEGHFGLPRHRQARKELPFYSIMKVTSLVVRLQQGRAWETAAETA